MTKWEIFLEEYQDILYPYPQFSSCVSEYIFMVSFGAFIIGVLTLLYYFREDYIEDGYWFGNCRAQRKDVICGMITFLLVCYFGTMVIMFLFAYVVPIISVLVVTYWKIVGTSILLPAGLLYLYVASAQRARQQHLCFNKLRGK